MIWTFVVALLSTFEGSFHAWMFRQRKVPLKISDSEVTPYGNNPVNRKFQILTRQWPRKHFYLTWNTIRLVGLLFVLWRTSEHMVFGGWTALPILALYFWSVHELVFTGSLNFFRDMAPDYIGNVTPQSSGYDGLLVKCFGDQAFNAKIIIAAVVAVITFYLTFLR